MKTFIVALNLVIFNFHHSNAFIPDFDFNPGTPEANIITEVPYIASIHSHKFICTATIVDEQFVLTAADCVQNLEPNSLHIHAGSADLSHGQWIEAEEVLLSEAISGHHNQIALIKLKEPLTLSENVKSISRISEESLNEAVCQESPGFVAGFEQNLHQLHDHDNTLRKVNLNLLPEDKCMDENHYVNYYHFKKDLHICFTLLEENLLAQFFGSPLIVDGKLAAVKTYNRKSENKFNSLLTKITLFEDFLNKVSPPPIPQPEPTSFPDQSESTSFPDQPKPTYFPDQPEPTSFPDQLETTTFPDQPGPTSFPDQPKPTSFPDQPNPIEEILERLFANFEKNVLDKLADSEKLTLETITGKFDELPDELMNAAEHRIEEALRRILESLENINKYFDQNIWPILEGFLFSANHPYYPGVPHPFPPSAPIPQIPSFPHPFPPSAPIPAIPPIPSIPHPFNPIPPYNFPQIIQRKENNLKMAEEEYYSGHEQYPNNDVKPDVDDNMYFSFTIFNRVVEGYIYIKDYLGGKYDYSAKFGLVLNEELIMSFSWNLYFTFNNFNEIEMVGNYTSSFLNKLDQGDVHIYFINNEAFDSILYVIAFESNKMGSNTFEIERHYIEHDGEKMETFSLNLQKNPIFEAVIKPVVWYYNVNKIKIDYTIPIFDSYRGTFTLRPIDNFFHVILANMLVPEAPQSEENSSPENSENSSEQE